MKTGTGAKPAGAMSDFARGVVGVLAVGVVVGVGALMLIPQSTPSAMRFAEPPAKPCGAQAWPASDRVCEKWTAPRRGGAGTHKPDGTAAAEPPLPAGPDAPPVAQSEPAAAREPARATASRSAQNARGAQRRKTEGLREMRRFGDDPSDVGASAYAPNGTRRTTTVRPASGTRGPGAGVAQGNGFFPLFR
jgi:hypothetical protein